MRILILTITVAALFCAAPAQAVVIFERYFEENRLEDSGWGFAEGGCDALLGTNTDQPRSVLDLSTDIAHNGTKSLKFTFNGGQGQALYIHPAGGTDRYARYWYRTIGFTYDAIGSKHLYWRNSSSLYPNGVSENIFGSRNFGFVIQNMVGVSPSGKADGVCVYEHPNPGVSPTGQ